MKENRIIKQFGILDFMVLVFVMFGCLSCSYFQREPLPKAVARVGEKYLFEEDIAGILPEGYTKEDSIKIVSSYINKWATTELLMLNAKRNISQDKSEEFDKLVEEYKKDLYGKYYEERILAKKVDTAVSKDEQLFFYEKNRDIFNLKENLMKLRYIYLKEEMQNQKEIESAFKRFDADDKKELDSLHLYFVASFLNDSVWVRADDVYQKITFLQNEKIKEGQYINHQDSTGIYLVKINKYLHENQQAPIEYVMPILKQIILNQRKIENAKQFEKELIQSAIKKKQFEVYE